MSGTVMVESGRDRQVAQVLAALILVLVGIALRPIWAPSQVERNLRKAAIALDEFRFGETLRLAEAILHDRPNSRQALFLAAEATASLHRNEESLAYYQRTLETVDASSVAAMHGAGVQSIRVGRISDAERYLRSALERDPGHIDAHQQLAKLLQLQGRSWESVSHLMELIRAGEFRTTSIQEICNTEAIWDSDHRLEEQCLEVVPDDPLPWLGRARKALLLNNSEFAEPLLRKIIEKHPWEMQAQARLGRLLLDSDEPFQDWHRGLPPAADEHPEIWITRGLWARRRGLSAEASRCFWEALMLNPEHPAATHQLALALKGLGRRDEAQFFADRAVVMDKLNSELGTLNTWDDYQRCANLLESLGRYWEGAALCYVAAVALDHPAWAAQGLERMEAKLRADASRCSISENVLRRLDLSRVPLPDFQTPSTRRTSIAPPVAPASRVQFVDLAHKSGLDFQYYNGADPQKKRVYMFEYSGGGVAVLDYDADGWPDIYLTQGCPWPLQPDQRDYRDRLFRNLGDGRFADVTESAGLGDNGMSHGATVGDVDNDGFPELYVANIGRNSFYKNNGDGTFTDVTLPTGTSAATWSSSCAFADLNGDALADLYVVSYLAGPKVFEKQCGTPTHPEQCGPMPFPAEQDRLFVNLGDGRFRDVTAESGIQAPDGKGLGLVVGRFDDSRRLSIFVANDTTPNFMFRNNSQGSGQIPRMVNEATFLGVACSESGQSQSCMGAAAGDANGDGLLDLFVTNFYNEPNALYIQTDDGTFADQIKEFGLHDLSFTMMGWGTQFLDAELDGWPDLVLTNGHINDDVTGRIPYKMPAQVLRNIGGTRFVVAPASSLGPYFQKKTLGRAVAKLDWNRDGLEDFCATHVDVPTALLTNRTPNPGHHLTLRLVGTRSGRDAIGTVVRITAGERTQTMQLTAGDGFYASNERRLVFGLGESEKIDRLEVMWPSGTDQMFSEIDADEELVLIEDRGSPVILRSGGAAPAGQ